jgi:type II secretory pathway component PulC
VAGVIVGKTRMAIVEDSNGNQKLVKEGDAIDGKKTIVGIDSGRVSVREDGKTKVIKLEEEKR